MNATVVFIVNEIVWMIILYVGLFKVGDPTKYNEKKIVFSPYFQKMSDHNSIPKRAIYLGSRGEDVM